MQYSKNLKLNLPERNDQYNLDHWNENTNNIDELIYQNQLNISKNQNDISVIFNGLNTKNVNDTNSVYYKLMKLIYPVGCLYWSSNNTNPSELFGGTWSQIKDKFILSAGDTYKNNEIGGSATVTLTLKEIPSHTHTGPSHTHSFTPSGIVSSHTHTGPSHTHSFTPSGTVSEHSHTVSIPKRGTGTTGRGDGGTGDWYFIVPPYTESTTTSSTTPTFTGTKGTTEASGTEKTGATTPTFTGTKGTTEASGTGDTCSSGGSEPHNNMPPYIVKYCWERTK